VSSGLTRAGLLARGAKGGVALAVGGSTFAALAGTASADPIPDGDLAYTRLLVGVELLAVDFYTTALAAKKFGAVGQKYIGDALSNEQGHLQYVSQILTGASLTPATADDFNFSYPKGSFDSAGAIAKLGLQLETLFLGAYLTAVGAITTAAFRGPLARIAASEAQHVCIWEVELGGRTLSSAFPAALPIDQVSDALDMYTS
jgi:Ferritin-like domain